MPPVTRFSLEKEVYDPLTCEASPKLKKGRAGVDSGAIRDQRYVQYTT